MLTVRVGPLDYDVALVTEYIRHEGEDCLGLCDNEKQQLLISDRASPAQRVAVFCHEYMEAWLYHFGGQEKDKEGYCDLFGLAMTQFVQQFAPGFVIDDSSVRRLPQRELDEQTHAEALRPIGKLRITERIIPAEPGDDGRAWRVRVVEPE
ncbi:MAG: hypothetical protein IT445_05710 [Phycisphaeraceae bacterium]|nr:hypothetical protein [Phycisphaeraceae bacterium]